VTPDQLLTKLSREAEEITAAIDRRQRALNGNITKAEKELFALLIQDFISELTFTKGVVDNSIPNLLTLLRLDRLFEAFLKDVMNPVTEGFVLDMFKIAQMTGIYYKAYAAESIIEGISASGTLLKAALGITPEGKVIKGSIMADIAGNDAVRRDLKQVILQSIQSNQTLKQLNQTLKDFSIGKKDEDGAINKFWKGRTSGYAYDLFNKVAEIKNEEFRIALKLPYFIYVGSPLRDSRIFCLKKKGKVFAVAEALNEWPTDPDLIGKKSGIPYNPLIDRGRWNCTDRIRYISEELAVQLDPKKVDQIKQSYGVINVD